MPSFSPTSSVSSVLLADVADAHNSLLDETLTLDTLSDTLSFTSPVTCGIPFLRTEPAMARPLRLGKHPALDMPGLTIDITARKNKIAGVSLTTPTRSTLGLKAQEESCIKDWAKSLEPSGAPGHVPWGDLEDSTPMAKKPDGIRSSPKTLPGLLAKSHSPLRHSRLDVPAHMHRRPLQLKSTTPLIIRRDKKRNTAKQTTNAVEDLVFEREITIKPSPDGKAERLSLQIPAITMNPEMVDIMLELQNLKSFFQRQGGDEEPEDQCIQESTLSREKEQDATKAPTLMLSNSHSALLISLPPIGSDSSLCTGVSVKTKAPSTSSPNPSASGPMPIAARRGRKMLAPLSLPPPILPLTTKLDSMDIMYPGPPTAFLGTPSAYSAGLLSPISGAEGVNGTAQPPAKGLDIQEMIENLRSQCAAFPATPNTPGDMSQSQNREILPSGQPLPIAPSLRNRGVDKLEGRCDSEKEGCNQTQNTCLGQDKRSFTKELSLTQEGSSEVEMEASSKVYVSQNLAKSTASFRAFKASHSSQWQLDRSVGRHKDIARKGVRASLALGSELPSHSAAQYLKNRRRTMAIVGIDRIGEWSSPARPLPTASSFEESGDALVHHTASPTFLPKHQSHASTTSASQPPRSILRNRKSVRFASLPGPRSSSTDYSRMQEGSQEVTDNAHQTGNIRRRRHTDRTVPDASVELAQLRGTLRPALRRNGRVSVPSSEPGRNSRSSPDAKHFTSDTTRLTLSPVGKSSVSQQGRNSEPDAGYSSRRHSTFTPATERGRARPVDNNRDALRPGNARRVSASPPTSMKSRPPPVIHSIRATTITPRKSTIAIDEHLPVPPIENSATPSANLLRPSRKSMAATERLLETQNKENRAVVFTRYAPSTVPTRKRDSIPFPLGQPMAHKERSLSFDNYNHDDQTRQKSELGKGSRMPVPLRNILTRFK